MALSGLSESYVIPCGGFKMWNLIIAPAYRRLRIDSRKTIYWDCFHFFGVASNLDLTGGFPRAACRKSFSDEGADPQIPDCYQGQCQCCGNDQRQDRIWLPEIKYKGGPDLHVAFQTIDIDGPWNEIGGNYATSAKHNLRPGRQFHTDGESPHVEQ